MRQKQVFVKRMNQDADPRTVAQGQYRSANNCRIGTSNTGNEGAAESVQSNSLISAGYVFPVGINKCIGTVADTKNNAIIFCYANQFGDHRIIHWDADTNVFTNILPTTWTYGALGWTGNTRLYNMRIVENGTDQILFFHDLQGIPMRINLNIRNMRPSVYSLSIDDISVARRPPFKEPSIAYAVDTASASSFIQNVFFQFRYCFVYEDNEISTWSPWSEISIPPQDGVLYNKIVVTFNSGPKGVVKVKVARRLGNGISDTGNNNPELYIFEVWEKGSNSDDTDYTVDFFNTEVLKPVSTVDSARNFSQVPLLVGAQEVVQSNQIIYFDITENYDNISNANVGVNLTYDKTGIGEFTYAENGLNNYEFFVGDWDLPRIGDFIIVQIGEFSFWVEVISNTDTDIGNAIALLLTINGFNATYSSGIVTTTYNYQNYFVRAYWVPKLIFKESQLVSWFKTNASQAITGGYVKIEFNSIELNGVNKLNLTDFEFYDDVSDCLVNITISVLCNFPGSSSYNAVLLDVDAGAPIYYTQGTGSAGTASAVGISMNINGTALMGKKLAFAIEKTAGPHFDTTGSNHSFEIYVRRYDSNIAVGFKSGAEHSFGIVYFDQYMRQGGVQATTKKYIDFPPQRTYKEYFNTAFDNTEGYIPQLDWEIKHLPPSWAYYYAWVYNGSNIKNYAQIIAYVSDPETNITGTYIEINPKNLFDFGYIYNAFSVGDRVRILSLPGVFWNDKQNPYPLSLMQSDYIEGLISGFSADSIKIQLVNTGINLSSLNQCLVEIFALDSSELFFEQNVYEIGNPTSSNRFHRGPVQNQDPNNPVTTPARGNFVGTCYFKFAANYTDDNSVYWYFTESNSINYAVESNYWNKGRVHIETPEQKQSRIPWMFRWGNQLLQNSQVNGMSMFDSGNFKILSAKYGTIAGAREVGYTLKILQESNYSTAFIGRREIQNADGSTQLVVSDGLIGTINPSESLYGTKYASSILMNGRDLYWIDTIRRKVIRESGNNPFPISDYNMSRYWINACNQIETLGMEILMGFDRQTECLFITRKLTNSQVTISFFDPERENEEPGWISEHDFGKTVSSVFIPIDTYGWVGQVFVSTLLGEIYRHNGSGYLNLFGESKVFSIQSIFNPEFDIEKVFLGHWVKSNRPFLRSTFIAPVSAQNPNGMRTFLLPGNYVVREAQYFADLKNDGYTKGLVAENSLQFKQQMVSGRPLREQYILAEIQYQGSNQFVLISHDIVWEVSPWT